MSMVVVTCRGSWNSRHTDSAHGQIHQGRGVGTASLLLCARAIAREPATVPVEMRHQSRGRQQGYSRLPVLSRWLWLRLSWTDFSITEIEQDWFQQLPTAPRIIESPDVHRSVARSTLQLSGDEEPKTIIKSTAGLISAVSPGSANSRSIKVSRDLTRYSNTLGIISELQVSTLDITDYEGNGKPLHHGRHSGCKLPSPRYCRDKVFWLLAPIGSKKCKKKLVFSWNSQFTPPLGVSQQSCQGTLYFKVP